MKAIYKLKKQNRHLKTLLSIGGWTYSPRFHPIVLSPAARATFVASAIRLLEDYGLDGLDVDYEYPHDAEHARGYVELLKELRQGLDAHARSKGANYRFLLTVSSIQISMMKTIQLTTRHRSQLLVAPTITSIC